MNIPSLALDGYGLYVWPSYGITFMLIGWSCVRAFLKYRQVKAKIKNQFKD